MIESLKQEAIYRGDLLKILSIERLSELKSDIDNFEEREALNQFQKFIIKNIYRIIIDY